MLEFISSILFYSSVFCGVSVLFNKKDKIILLIASLNAFILIYYISGTSGTYNPALLAILLSIIFLFKGISIIWILFTKYHIVKCIANSYFRKQIGKQIGIATVFLINSIVLFTWMIKSR